MLRSPAKSQGIRPACIGAASQGLRWKLSFVARAKERHRMKLHCIGTLLVVLTGALMLASAPATDLQRGQDASASPDVWGGNHVSLEITPQGATLEFDCAHGNISEPIKANAKGEFAARGTYTPERGGPISRCLLYTSPSPRDRTRSRMPSSA